MRRLPRWVWASRSGQASYIVRPLLPREMDPLPGRITDENQLRSDRGFRPGVLDAWCALVWRVVRPEMDGAGRDHDGTSQKPEPRASLRHLVCAESADRVRTRAVVPVEKCEYGGTRGRGRRTAVDRYRRADC